MTDDFTDDFIKGVNGIGAWLDAVPETNSMRPWPGSSKTREPTVKVTLPTPGRIGFMTEEQQSEPVLVRPGEIPPWMEEYGVWVTSGILTGSITAREDAERSGMAFAPLYRVRQA